MTIGNLFVLYIYNIIILTFVYSIIIYFNLIHCSVHVCVKCAVNFAGSCRIATEYIVYMQ